MTNKDLQAVTHFIFEVGILSKTPRSGLWFIGNSHKSIADHLLRTTYIGYALAKLTPRVDVAKVVLMCLTHDLAEARTSDLNYVHQRYGRLAEAQAIEDLAQALPFGSELKKLYQESSTKETLEARITKDADQLEWIATLCEEAAKGNNRAKVHARVAAKRMLTPTARKLVKILLTTEPDSWWFNQHDPWFVSRKEKDRKPK